MVEALPSFPGDALCAPLTAADAAALLAMAGALGAKAERSFAEGDAKVRPTLRARLLRAILLFLFVICVWSIYSPRPAAAYFIRRRAAPSA